MAADHLTTSDNPAKPKHSANAQADILNGNALPAKQFIPKSSANALVPAGDPDHTQIYEFTFSGVSGTGIDSEKFYSSVVTLEIDFHSQNSSSGSDGNYQITLYKKGLFFNKNLGTTTQNIPESDRVTYLYLTDVLPFTPYRIVTRCIGQQSPKCFKRPFFGAT